MKTKVKYVGISIQELLISRPLVSLEASLMRQQKLTISRYFSHLLAVRSGEAHRLAAGDAAAGAQGDGRRDLAAARRAARQEPHARAPRVAAQGADRLRRPQATVRVSKNINEPNLSAASLRLFCPSVAMQCQPNYCGIGCKFRHPALCRLGGLFAASNPSVRVRPKFPEKSAPNNKTESEGQLGLLVALA